MMSEVAKLVGLYSTLWRLIALAITAIAGVFIITKYIPGGQLFDLTTYDKSTHSLIGTLCVVAIYASVELAIYAVRKVYDFFALINRAGHRILTLLTPAAKKMLLDAYCCTNSSIVERPLNHSVRLLVHRELIREGPAPSFGKKEDYDLANPWTYIIPFHTRVALLWMSKEWGWLRTILNLVWGKGIELLFMAEKSVSAIRAENLKQYLKENYTDRVLNEGSEVDPLKNPKSIVYKVKIQAQQDDKINVLKPGQVVLVQTYYPEQANGRTYKITSRQSEFHYACDDTLTRNQAKFHIMYLTPVSGNIIDP